uniref:uncharacterized protein LOC131140272 n=1 Tax=Doryrhamphus excisus TaxID=161450 RepID=UPI0025ADF8BE|nr:uncharacterized protein LOC131140272 [Doryrhamphus excisus]
MQSQKKATIIPEKNEHLKPLSMYSRINIGKSSLSNFPEPYINYKFELVDSGATKRKLDDSHPKNRSKTSAKKQFNPKALKPDCFSVFCRSPVKQRSRLVLSQAASLAKTPSSSGHVACESTPTRCDHKGIDPCMFKDENLQQQPATDADDLLSVKPSDTCTPNVKHKDEDNGYLSMCLTPSMLTPPTSSPPLKVAEDNLQLASELQKATQVAQKGCGFSLAMREQDSTLGGFSWHSPVEPLGDFVEEVWNIGPPIMESSICTNEGEANGNRSGVEVMPNETQSLQEDSTLDTDTSFQVQVKSVVQIPRQDNPSVRQAATSTKSDSERSTGQVYITSRRPVVFNTVEDWEREKGVYVQSVLRHINEGSGAAPDAVGELWNLMAQVGRDSSGRRWRHPCDLTCRNYQARLGKVIPKMTLYKWQAKNSLTHKHFDKVPKVFERSTFP